MEIATGHDMVMRNPEPFVVFNGFGDSSLDFELRVYLYDVLNGLTVRNAIRLEIFKRFKDAGIEIPFPQRDVNLRIQPVDAGPVSEMVSPPTKDVSDAGNVPDKIGDEGLTDTGGDGDAR